MAPEQAMAEPLIDARADVYALGAVTYEMLAGEPPFTGPNAQAIVAKSMTERPRPLSAIRETVPPALADAVATALAKLPADRFASAEEFALAVAQRDGPDRRRSAPATGPYVVPGRSLDRRQAVVVIAVVCAAVLAIAVWVWRRSDGRLPEVLAELSVPLPARITVAPLVDIAISSDGSRLVFPAEAGGKRLLYVRDLGDMTVRPIPGTALAVDPFLSPDGRRVGFAAGGALWTVPLAGGVPEQIPGTNDGSIDPGAGVDGATWTEGDTILYAPRFRTGRGVLKVSAAGGSPTSVALPDTAAGQVSLAQPRMLPGGRSLLAIVTLRGSRPRQAGIVSLATGAVRLLDVRASFAEYASGYLLYSTGDGGLYAASFDVAHGVLTGDPVRLGGIDGLVGPSFAVSGAGVLAYLGGAPPVSDLVQVSRNGTSRVLDDSGRSYDVPRVSPDGKRVAVGVGTRAGTRDIWIFDIGRGSLQRLTRGGDNICPLWSVDGTRIAFAAAVAGTYDVLSLAADGEGVADTLVSGGAFHFPGAFSPDGKWLVYRQNSPRTNEDLFAVSMDGAHTVRTLVASPFTEISPALSPDGRWLAYVSDESARREVYARRFDGSGGAVQISVAGGDEPRWAPNGREMYYRTSDSMYAVQVTTAQSITAGRPMALFADSYRHSERYTDYDVLPDGTAFVMLAPQRDVSADVRVVIGWPVLLRPRNRH
jgi:serine/threonine-protein kinase